MTEKVIEGIVIGSTQLNEKDKMIRAVSKDGFFSFFAKGVSSITSKNAPSLISFSKSRFTLFVSSQNKYSLKTGLPIKLYYSMTSYSEMAIFSLLEEVLKLFNNETTSNYYSFLEECLEELSAGLEPVFIALKFLINLLKMEGICSSSNDLLLSEKLRKTFTQSTNNTNYQIDYSDSKEILNSVINYIESYFNISLKTKDLIKLL